MIVQTLVSCRTEVCKALGLTEEECELSMGMSGDFEQAVRNKNAILKLVVKPLFLLLLLYLITLLERVMIMFDTSDSAD